MKLHMRIAGCLAVLLLSMGQLGAFAHPKAFSDLTLAQAREQAKKAGKLVVADFTATWCGPCHKMDENTWSAAPVEQWIAKNAIAVQIDVDKEEKLSREFKISAMPSVLIFRPEGAGEFDRQVGYQEPKQLLAWFDAASKGMRSIDLLKSQLKAVQGKGGTQEVQMRYEVARALVDAEDLPGATEQYLWLWKNMAQTDPQSIGVRDSYVADNIAQLAAQDSNAKTQFEKLRAEAKESNVPDWVLLNSMLGHGEETLAWFDTAKKDPKQAENISKSTVDLRKLLLERKRWADIAVLYPHPLDDLRREHEIAAIIKKRAPYNPFPESALLIYAALLAAGRNDEAKQVLAESYKLEDTPEMHKFLDQAPSLIKSK